MIQIKVSSPKLPDCDCSSFPGGRASIGMATINGTSGNDTRTDSSGS